MQGRLRGGPYLVEQHRAQPGPFGAVVVGRVGVGDDQFTQQRADGRHGRGVETERVVGGGQPP